MQRPSGPLLFILLNLLIDAIGIGIIFPIMPELMDRVGAGSVAEGAFWAGILAASYAAAQFIFAPIVGAISDAYGRRPVLMVTLALLVLDYVIMALAASYWLLLLGRSLAGVAGATFVTATAYIADITPKEDRAARFGLIGAAFGLGFVLGPALGGIAAEISLTAPFWLAAALAFGNLMFGLLVLPESLPEASRRPFTLRDSNPFAIIREAFRIPGLSPLLTGSVVVEFGTLVYVVLWAFWGRETFGWSTLPIGITLSIYGILLATAQALIMPRAVAWLGEARLALWGLVLSVAVFAGFGFAQQLWMLAILLPLAALTDLVPPTIGAMAANVTSEDRQGMVQGVIASLASLAAVIAPLVYTPIFGLFAGPEAWVYLPGAPFLLAGVLVALVIPLLLRGTGEQTGGDAT